MKIFQMKLYLRRKVNLICREMNRNAAAGLVLGERRVNDLFESNQILFDCVFTNLITHASVNSLFVRKVQLVFQNKEIKT